jgi:uncharacterized protein (DUF433 family)
MKWPLSTKQPIPFVAFDIDHVAQLTGLSVSQLVRWDRKGFFHPTFADPNRRRPNSRIYSEHDVVALRIIAKLRDARVPLAEFKSVAEILAPGDHGELLDTCFYVVGKRFFTSRDEASAAARELGEDIEPTTIEVRLVIAELERGIARLEERPPEGIGLVVRKRGIMRGVPIIAGTRIPTETIAWFHDNGYSLSWILENFPRLTEKDVEAAVAFENARAADPPAAVAVHR